MDGSPGTEHPVTGVTSAPEPAKRAASREYPWRKDSRPANPFGDLVELVAGEQLILAKEFRDFIEEGSRICRPHGIFHGILRSRYAPEKGALPPSAASSCFSCN